MKIRVVKLTGGGWSAGEKTFIPSAAALVDFMESWLLLGYSIEVQN